MRQTVLDGPTIVSNSRRRTLAACQFKWFLRYVLKLQPRKRVATLERGTLWGKVMDEWWRQWRDTLQRYGDPDRALGFTMAYLEELREQTLQGCRARFSVRDGTSAGLDESEVEDMFDTIAIMLRGYHDKWKGQRMDGPTLRIEAKAEGAVLTPSGAVSPVLRYSGVMDKLIRGRDGRWWVFEHKNTKRSLETWRSQNDYNPQAVGYLWLMRQLLPPEDIGGVIYDLALYAKPATPESIQPVKDGSRLAHKLPSGATLDVVKRAHELHGIEPDEWWREKMAELQNRPDMFYLRSVQVFTEEEVGRFEAELYYAAQQYRDAERAAKKNVAPILEGGPDLRCRWAAITTQGQRFPRDSGACFAYNRPCEYMHLCRYRDYETMAAYEVREDEYDDDSKTDRLGE